MRWWGQPEQAKRLATKSETVRREAVRLREQMLAMASELDGFVAALNAEVEQQRDAEGGPS